MANFIPPCEWGKLGEVYGSPTSPSNWSVSQLAPHGGNNPYQPFFIWQLFIILWQPVVISVTVFSNLKKLTNDLKTDLQALYLSGSYCHKTGIRSPSCNTPRDPTIYLDSKSILLPYLLCVIDVLPQKTQHHTTTGISRTLQLCI